VRFRLIGLIVKHTARSLASARGMILAGVRVAFHKYISAHSQVVKKSLVEIH
jgi:hypothetical protein